MTYNPNIPQPADLLSVSQSDILTNFQQLDAVFDNDHYDYSFAGGAAAPYDIAVAGDKGKHKQVTFVRASADIANAGADELGLFNKNTGAGAQELYLRRESGGTVIQMTAGDPTVAASGATFLPGGLLLQWGLAGPYVGDSTPTINFPTAFGAVPYNIQATMLRNVSNVDVVYVRQAPTTTNFQLRINQVGSSQIYWMALGVAP